MSSRESVAFGGVAATTNTVTFNLLPFAPVSFTEAKHFERDHWVSESVFLWSGNLPPCEQDIRCVNKQQLLSDSLQLESRNRRPAMNKSDTVSETTYEERIYHLKLLRLLARLAFHQIRASPGNS